VDEVFLGCLCLAAAILMVGLIGFLIVFSVIMHAWLLLAAGLAAAAVLGGMAWTTRR
jgi:hypothetical protein